MSPVRLAPLVFLGLLLGAGEALAADGWHADLEAGLSAAAKSGRPVLVVTAWKSGV
jgi:hypothetical protein